MDSSVNDHKLFPAQFSTLFACFKLAYHFKNQAAATSIWNASEDVTKNANRSFLEGAQLRN